ncbi:DEAD/DEAH box helicase family protein [Enterococcus sp. AZ072]|uniref:DEAD/DEAH box helicase family protein n=1 Tax=unclassified Enterococcus TaxID=2608891 RepID=UPI003D299468
MWLSDEKIQWRSYQKHLLANFSTYLTNDSVHLVAPPGAGKTFLGIEMVRRLDCKTLILVPSLLLKKQWLTTIEAFFLVDSADSCYLSGTIEEPARITVETYQTIYNRLKEEPTYFDQLQLELLVFDEAHHLKKSWGELLVELKKKHPKLLTISLTATPPIDSSQAEWKQYLDLNGMIDEEISIPELVKEGVLCPHQDFLYLIPANQEITQHYFAFLAKQNELVTALMENKETVDYLLSLDFIKLPLEHSAEIYENFELFTSALIFLNHHGYELTPEHWQLLGISKKQGKKSAVPPLGKKQLNTIYQRLFAQQPDLSIFYQLKKAGWLYDEGLHMFPEYPDTVANHAVPEKKKAVCQILIKEEVQLKQDMTAVVLTDRICKEVLAGGDGTLAYGVVPLFDEIVSLLGTTQQIGAICGEFLLLPQQLVTVELAELAIGMKEHPYISGYFCLTMDDKNRQALMQAATRLLTEKKLNILVGTVSLLGEGWDCPAINLLILANQASSFVQTQQLRGRGLRLGAQDKVTNIWHLGVGLPGVSLTEQPDLTRIFRRLGYISGLTFEEPSKIESGGDRFTLPLKYTTTTMETYTQSMFYFSSERTKLKERWTAALASGWHLSMPVIIRKVDQESQGPEELLPVVVKNTKKPTFWRSLLNGSLSEYLQLRGQQKQWQKECEQKEILANCVQKTLQQLGEIAERKAVVEADQQEFSCYLENAGYREGQLFAAVILELFAPIENPRYLAEGKKLVFPVPERFARNKQTASLFLKELNQQSLPKCQLVYTRNPVGRQKLVAYRMAQSFQVRNNTMTQKNIWT